ncbi:MAG: hypothetical protein KKC18_16835 [Chloroflexi bacterium]|nr:hypothetical protein [Chloroflexota bacterium]
MKRPRWLVNSCLIALVLTLACGCVPGGNDSPLLQDDFEDPGSGWDADERDEFERGYEEGEYFLELRESNWFAWAYLAQRFDDVNIEVQATLLSDPQDGHLGILCRHVDMENFYYFAISGDGYYAIFRRVDGDDLEALTGDGNGMTHSPAIKTGGQSNNVRAVCQGEELSLYVNGQLLETVNDDTHPRGEIGIGAGSGPAGGARARFDNFVVTRPQSGEP